jgi:hypothetical protein
MRKLLRKLKLLLHTCSGPVKWSGEGKGTEGSLFGRYKTDMLIEICKCNTCGKLFGTVTSASGTTQNVPAAFIHYAIRTGRINDKSATNP